MLPLPLLDAFLESAREGELFAPLHLLIGQRGFSDVHFTHGAYEFGKDFIAKKDGRQWAIQAKAGDIGQAEWRREIWPQLLEAATSSAVHPNFDGSAPRTVLLVFSGRFKGKAATLAQSNFRDQEDRLSDVRFEVWTGSELRAAFADSAEATLTPLSPDSLKTRGNLLELIGRTIEGTATCADIERYSRSWLGEATPEALLAWSVEAAVLHSAASRSNRWYEAVAVHVCLIRSILEAAVAGSAMAVEAFAAGVVGISARMRQSLSEVQEAWEETERRLARAGTGPSAFATYPVLCSRIIEVAGLHALIAPDDEAAESARFLREFVESEQGCGHIAGDRGAVSLVPAVLALSSAGNAEIAATLVRRAGVWICDRYEKGAGLADVDDGPGAELSLLLGYPFVGVAERDRRESYAATVCADLALFLGEAELFGDLLNDYEASRMVLIAWCPTTTKAVFRIHDPDVLQVAAVRYTLDRTFGSLDFGTHLAGEADALEALAAFPLAPLLLGACLRDRHFPTAWENVAGE